LIIIVWTIVIGGPVQDLNLSFPFTDRTILLQEPLEIFGDTMASLVSALPWLDTPYTLIIIAIQIKMLLIFVDLFRWIVGLFTNQ